MVWWLISHTDIFIRISRIYNRISIQGDRPKLCKNSRYTRSTHIYFTDKTGTGFSCKIKLCSDWVYLHFLLYCQQNWDESREYQIFSCICFFCLYQLNVRTQSERNVHSQTYRVESAPQYRYMNIGFMKHGFWVRAHWRLKNVQSVRLDIYVYFPTRHTM